MSLYDFQRDCKASAAKLPKRYESYDINELADEFCAAREANDSTKMNIYYSALILRFWSNIDNMFKRCCEFRVSREESYDKLYDCIDYVLQHKVWHNPEKNTNAQACIHQVINSRGIPGFIGAANFQKNLHTEVSMDEPISEDGETTIGDMLPYEDNWEANDSAHYIIQSLVSHNKLVEAIIADNIAYHDVFKHDKKIIKSETDGEEYKYSEYSSEFWPFRLVQTLNTLDEKYIEYFSEKYVVNIDKLRLAMKDIEEAGNQKKYRMISKFQEIAKDFV